ncbi:hypothetical protein IKQ26_03765 [bacterium]|nr:hypothetical protein [bacterium]
MLSQDDILSLIEWENEQEQEEQRHREAMAETCTHRNDEDKSACKYCDFKAECEMLSR